MDVVETSSRSVAAFALPLATGPTVWAQLMLSGQDMDSGLFARSMDEGTKLGG